MSKPTFFSLEWKSELHIVIELKNADKWRLSYSGSEVHRRNRFMEIYLSIKLRTMLLKTMIRAADLYI